MRRFLITLLAALMAVSLFALPASASTNVDALVEFNDGPGDNNFDILITVVANDTDLVDVVNGIDADNPGTILAPTDKAFIRAARQAAFLTGERDWRKINTEAEAVEFFTPLLGSDLLQGIVAGHVIGGAAATADVVFDRRVNRFDTLNGRILAFDRGNRILDGSGRFSRVIAADAIVVEDVIVVHGINNVIFPRGTIRTLVSPR